MRLRLTCLLVMVLVSSPVHSEAYPHEWFARTTTVISEAIKDSAFPGAQIVVVKDGSELLNASFGRHTYEPNAREVDEETVYDLASLTKVLATTAAVMLLHDTGKLNLDDTAGSLIPEFRTAEKRSIKIRHLLTHTSGLAPFFKLYDVCSTPQQALDTIYNSALVASPGESVVYSDLGMITLAKIVEHVSGKSLDRFVGDEFYRPLGMQRTMFVPPGPMRSEVAPTEVDTVWRMHLVQGTVHDERAELLGGVAGHAGLFSTASDVARFMRMLMNGGTFDGRRYLEEETIKLFTTRAEGAGTRALGWDTKSEQGSTAGDLFSPSSYGHTGFTGTSIWVDPEKNVCVIFLTNRVYPTRANRKISRVRPALHNAVMQDLENTH